MSNETEKKTVDRRSFFRSLGGVAVAGAAASSTVVATPARAAESKEERTKARYKGDSEDVKAFYRVNRY